MTARACAISAFAAAVSRRSAILSRASAGEVIDCRGPASPAGRHRHPGAFPRAGPHPQGRPGERLAFGGDGRRHCGVRDAQHRPADRERRSARRQGQARASPHALRLCLFRRRHRDNTRRSRRAGAAAGLRRHQGVHGLLDRLAAGRRRCRLARRAEGDPPPRLIPRRGRAAAERAQEPAHRGRRAFASRLARRSCRAQGDRSAWSRSRTRPARASTCCTSRPRRRWSFSPVTRMWLRSRPRRIISRWRRPDATSGSARARR